MSVTPKPQPPRQSGPPVKVGNILAGNPVVQEALMRAKRQAEAAQRAAEKRPSA